MNCNYCATVIAPMSASKITSIARNYVGYKYGGKTIVVVQCFKKDENI